MAAERNTIRFTVDPAVTKLGIRCVAFVVKGLDNTKYPDGWDERRAEVMATVQASVADGQTLLDRFRHLHTAVGAPNRKNLAAPESLRKTVTSGRALPTINPVVDLYNLTSLATCAAIGAHDCSKVAGSVALRLARGDEAFVPLGLSEPTPVSPGEYVYVDGSNSVICRLEVRQGMHSVVTESTKDCLFIVQGHDGFAVGVVRYVAEQLMNDVVESFGGRATMVCCLDS